MSTIREESITYIILAVWVSRKENEIVKLGNSHFDFLKTKLSYLEIIQSHATTIYKCYPCLRTQRNHHLISLGGDIGYKNFMLRAKT